MLCLLARPKVVCPGMPICANGLLSEKLDERDDQQPPFGGFGGSDTPKPPISNRLFQHFQP